MKLKMKMTKERWILAGAAALAIIVLGVGIFLFAHRDDSAAAFDTSGAAQTLATSSAPAGYLEYSNQRYHFSVWYPPNLQVQTYGGTGQDLTVTLQDPTTNEGFQVFVVPYDEPQVTQARFKLDEPSGILDDPTNIVIDGAQATMFYSTNAVMGDTREVWFINAGLLYEVTTYKQLDSWLAQIMGTWRFVQ